MLNLNTKTPEQIIETTAPISMENLQLAMTDPEIAIIIDYANSTLRGKQLLTYLSNLALPFDVKITSEVSKDERFELVREYMSMNGLLGAPSLVLTVGSILTALKGNDDFYKGLRNPVLNADEIIEFIKENQKMVSKWKIVMDSMIVYAMKASKKFQDAFGDPKLKYENIDDETAIGKNFVHLFDVAIFMEEFFKVPGNKFYYFTKQFEDYMFAQQNLFYYFMKPSNPLPASLESIGSDHYNVGDLIKEYDEIEARLTEE